MLLTIATTHRPATDLGYLLHKNPGRFQSYELAFGKAHVFYPEATDDHCSAALMLDVDPVPAQRVNKHRHERCSGGQARSQELADVSRPVEP